MIKAKYGMDACNVGDEGGFAPNIQDNMEGLDLLKVAIEKAGYTGKVKIGMDVAASEFYENGKYNLDFKSKEPNPASIVSADALGAIYQDMIKNYPVVSIEDGYDQDDWEAWSKFQAATNIQLVGDDLTVTNTSRIRTAIDKKACNCLLLKVRNLDYQRQKIFSDIIKILKQKKLLV